VYGTMGHNGDRLSECLIGSSDTNFRPFPSNGPNYRSYFGGPNIQAMATKIAMKLVHHYLNIIRQDNIVL
jgi:hypothetical protein